MKGSRRHVRISTLISLAALVAVLGLILGWWRCGWGRGEGSGAAESAAPDVTSVAAEATAPGAVPCVLRLDAAGLTVDGRTTDVAGAVTACGGRGAQIHVVGDVLYGRFDELKRAFEAAKIHLDVRD